MIQFAVELELQEVVQILVERGASLYPAIVCMYFKFLNAEL